MTIRLLAGEFNGGLMRHEPRLALWFDGLSLELRDCSVPLSKNWTIRFKVHSAIFCPVVFLKFHNWLQTCQKIRSGYRYWWPWFGSGTYGPSFKWPACQTGNLNKSRTNSKHRPKPSLSWLLIESVKGLKVKLIMLSDPFLGKSTNHPLPIWTISVRPLRNLTEITYR